MKLESGAGYIKLITTNREELLEVYVNEQKVLKSLSGFIFTDPNYIIPESDNVFFVLSNNAKFRTRNQREVNEIAHSNRLSRIGNEKYSISTLPNTMILPIYTWTMERFTKLLSQYDHTILYLNDTSKFPFLVTVKRNNLFKIFTESSDIGALFLWDQIARHGFWDIKILDFASNIRIQIPNLNEKVNRFKNIDDTKNILRSIFIIIALQNASEQIGLSKDFRDLLESYLASDLVRIQGIVAGDNLVRELISRISEYLELRDPSDNLLQSYSNRINRLKLN
ncbi:MAG: hypothetical protein QXL02_02035 [Candidatus Anstonellales archaeon]